MERLLAERRVILRNHGLVLSPSGKWAVVVLLVFEVEAVLGLLGEGVVIFDVMVELRANIMMMARMAMPVVMVVVIIVTMSVMVITVAVTMSVSLFFSVITVMVAFAYHFFKDHDQTVTKPQDGRYPKMKSASGMGK